MASPCERLSSYFLYYVTLPDVFEMQIAVSFRINFPVFPGCEIFSQIYDEVTLATHADLVRLAPDPFSNQNLDFRQTSQCTVKFPSKGRWVVEVAGEHIVKSLADYSFSAFAPLITTSSILPPNSRRRYGIRPEKNCSRRYRN